MSQDSPPKPTGLIVGALVEALLFGAFALFVGLDHAFLFVGVCGLMFGIALLKVATTPSDPDAEPGVDPDHARIASINNLFPRAVVVSAVLVAVVSLGLGTDTIHGFARDTLGFDTFMTAPLLRL